MFTITEQMEPMPQPGGYVSIAIYVNGLMYAQGNNLQVLLNNPSGIPEFWDYLLYNNAPNVSDVVYLIPGDIVEIFAFQNIDPMGLGLGQGPSQTYVSIHKDS